MKDEEKEQLAGGPGETRHRAGRPEGERRKAAETPEEKDRFFHDVLDSILDGISILDKDLNIILTNRIMEQWYAHHIPLRGKKCYEAYHGRTEPCEVCPSMRTLRSGKQDFDVVPMTGPEGVRGWLELYTFPLVDFRTGRLAGVIEYVRDITERKRMEEEREKLIHELQEALVEIKALKVMIPPCALHEKNQRDAIKRHYDSVLKKGKCSECLKALRK
jgi:PAS domain S-box-containing protein